MKGKFSMGTTISVQNYFGANLSGLMKPIIYCCPAENVYETAVPINLLLSKKLADFKPNKRTMQLETCFNQIINQLPDGVTIKDFEVMFNPEYKVDVLKILIAACKKKPFSVVWPGSYKDGKLFFAENGYPDFKMFNIDDYDVTCIV